MDRPHARWFAGASACLLAAGCSVSYEPLHEPPGVMKTRVVETRDGGDTAVVIPGPEYSAGWLHETFFGAHYRDLWTAPVAVPVLDLDSFAGGLTPTEAGGGFQTKSLRFVSADGRHFKFRSVDKDPTSVLPPELRNTFAADLAKDQISSSHPSAALVVDSLAGIVGVPRLHPALVLLPDDNRLGEFRARYGGTLGIFERYPEPGPRGLEMVPCAVSVQNGLKMFRSMDEDSRRRPDAGAYLRARLLDVYVGDWDRHVKQWRWARCEEGERVRWEPLPMDRDQAFALFDGFVPWIAEMAVPQFDGFGEDYNELFSVTYSGRFLDRRIFPALDRPAWDSITADVVARLTDGAIAGAVDAMPPEHRALVGDALASALRNRRDRLPEISREYYRMVADFVDVYLSDRREAVEVDRCGEDSVRVTAWIREKETGLPTGSPVYDRIFDGRDTREIRLYLMGGDDSVVVSGDVETSIDLRVIGGKGDDRLIDRSHVRGVLWGVVPFIPQADRSTWFYGGTGRNSILAGPSCTVIEKDDSP